MQTLTKYQVEETTDYDLFKFMKGNRNVNPFNLKRIKESMSVRPLFSPVMVNEKFEIIDGQHRFLACKELGLPVYYIVTEGYSIEEIHILNTNSSNWKRLDYLTGYVDIGLRPYIKFKEFMDEYNEFGIKAALHICTYPNTNQEKSKQNYFENGDLKMFDLQEAKLLAGMIKDFGNFYKGYNRPSFVVAVCAIIHHKNYNHKQMMSKLSRKPQQITDQTNHKLYIDQLEEIFNFSRRQKETLKY